MKIFNSNFTQSIQNINTRNLRINSPQISFCGNDSMHISKENGIGTVNHQTILFREPKTDEWVQNFIKEQFKNGAHVVSGACSSGEEAYSYACMLCDDVSDLKVSGFDIDDSVVEVAQSGRFDIKRYFGQNDAGTRLLGEGFLIDDNNGGGGI